MSSLQKQALPESLHYQVGLIELACQAPASDREAKVQCVQLSRTLLQQLTGSPDGNLL